MLILTLSICSWLTILNVLAQFWAPSVLMPMSRHLLHARGWCNPTPTISSLLRSSKMLLGMIRSKRSLIHGLALSKSLCRALSLLVSCTCLMCFLGNSVPKSRNWSIPGRTLVSDLSPQLLLHIRASLSVLIVRLDLANIGDTRLTRVMASISPLRR